MLAQRWRQLVVRCGAALTPVQAFRFSMIAGFFNQTLPSSVGGDAVRIWLVGKRPNWRVAAYSVLLDRVIGTVALAMMVVACLPWTLELVRNPIGRAALLLIGLAASPPASFSWCWRGNGCASCSAGRRRATLRRPRRSRWIFSAHRAR